MKNTLIKRIAQISGGLALAISVALAVIYYLGIGDDAKLSANVDLMMNWTVVLLIVVVVFAFLISPILSILTNPKALVKGIVSIVVLAVIVGIAYSFSSTDTSNIHIIKEVPNLAQKAKITDMGLVTLYIVGGLTILSILLSEVKNLLKL